MTQQRLAFDPPDAPPLAEQRLDTQATAAPRITASPLEPRSAPAAFADNAALASAVFVRNPRARRYVVRVRPDGVVRVTIPNRGSKRQAMVFAEQQRDWIATELARAARERAQPREVLAPEVLAALRQQAKRELPPRLLGLAATFSLSVSRVTIRSQRWRWGSCSRAGHISLNWRLVTMPEWVRDYVLIHELMHLRRMDHSPAFWQHVATACPNYQEARAWLRQFKTLPPPA
jgi:predicted metal-dependent hydrolase